MESDVSRRAVLLAGTSGIAATAGCLGALSDPSGPQDLTFIGASLLRIKSTTDE